MPCAGQQPPDQPLIGGGWQLELRGWVRVRFAFDNAVSHLAMYAVAIAVGTAITTAALLILKPSLEEPKIAARTRAATAK